MKWVMLTMFVIAALTVSTALDDVDRIIIRGSGGDIAMIDMVNHGPPSAKYHWVPLPGCDDPPHIRFIGGMLMPVNCKRVPI